MSRMSPQSPHSNSVGFSHLSDGLPGDAHIDGDSSANGNGHGKRRSDGQQLTPAHSRSKRSRYVAIACSECKRRKIKCNGQTPCERCGNLSLECVYTPNCCSTGFRDSEEFHQINQDIHTLQDQVHSLHVQLSALQNKRDRHAIASPPETYPSRSSMAPSSGYNPYPPSIAPPSPKARITPFQGPTSSAFNFDVANTSLKAMGIAGIATSEPPVPDYTADGLGLQHKDSHGDTPGNQNASTPKSSGKAVQDPLWNLDRDEVRRLCRVYEEETCVMYPMLDIERTMTKADAFFNFMRSASRTGLLDSDDGFQDDDSNILKMVLAVASTTEQSGQCELGQKLFESVRPAVEDLLWQPIRVKGLMILVLVSQYFFQLDDEAQAYRVSGLASRLCFEMGLHRHEILTKTFKSEEACSWAVRLFWSIYVLDRRWSFGTGMPFAMQDMDIDPALPEPDTGTPYLATMVSYGRISSRAWKSISAFDPNASGTWKEDVSYLDYQIQQWQANIPEALRYEPTSIIPTDDRASRVAHRLSVVLYLRANLLRIMIYRPVLHSATSIMENSAYAMLVVELAKDSIRQLTHLNRKSEIYRRQQVCFNYFLISALAVLFLAVSHAPVEFSKRVRDEFYMALDLVKGFSTKSCVSKRLWKTIKGLKEVGPRLGVEDRHQTIVDTGAEDPHSSAAVAMAGLAGHPINNFSAQQLTKLESPSRSNTLESGHQLSTELTNLFEAAHSCKNTPAVDPGTAQQLNRYGERPPGMTQGYEGMSTLFGSEEEFSKIMWDLF
ncbi:hypothetical protein MMC25_001822 [Agyrium rufum]|nr:hypothetical protein [Agyrium rufum]